MINRLPCRSIIRITIEVASTGEPHPEHPHAAIGNGAVHSARRQLSVSPFDFKLRIRSAAKGSQERPARDAGGLYRSHTRSAVAYAHEELMRRLSRVTVGLRLQMGLDHWPEIQPRQEIIKRQHRSIDAHRQCEKNHASAHLRRDQPGAPLKPGAPACPHFACGLNGWGEPKEEGRQRTYRQSVNKDVKVDAEIEPRNTRLVRKILRQCGQRQA